MESLIFQYLTAWEPLAYIIIFFGMMVEGDTVLFIAAFLTHQGILHILPALLTALWGMILGDNLWYTLGFKLKNSNTFLNQWAEKLAKPFDEHLKNHPLRTTFLSKFTYGVGHAIFFRAGAIRIRWGKLEQSDILATLFWMAVVAGLGYFSSASFSLAKHYLRFGEIALLLGLIIFFTLKHLIVKKSKGKF